MATITHNHIPGVTVWVLTEDCGVKHGTVIRFRAEVLITETKLFYDIRLDEGGIGTAPFKPDKVFAEADLQLALDAYEATLT
ncbi:MAG: hypothetical protein ACREAU_00555 [Nitrosopumilaceae archaeon]